MRSGEIMEELSLKKKAPVVLKNKKPGDLIRLGVIGYGWRGAQDVKAAGFGNPEWAAKANAAADKNKLDKRFIHSACHTFFYINMLSGALSINSNS